MLIVAIGKLLSFLKEGFVVKLRKGSFKIEVHASSEQSVSTLAKHSETSVMKASKGISIVLYAVIGNSMLCLV